MCRSVLVFSVAATAFAAQGPVIVLIGPPGGGKTTQSAYLRTAYSLPVIAAEDVVKENSAELTKRRRPGVSYGDLREDPALARYFRAKLDTVDLEKGVVLDGYPATAFQAEDFAKLIKEKSLSKLIILQLAMPDDVIRKRLAASGEPAERIEQRMKDYVREFGMIRTYYPEAPIVTIEGAGKEKDVSKKIRSELGKHGIKPAK